jgi:methylenetetrahydrofolate reductase (NADPH)
MRIDQLIAERTDPVFSFEFFPPQTAAGERNLQSAVSALRELEPAFVSVTKTGKSTQLDTIELVRRIRDEHGFEAVAHFTCAGASHGELRGTLDRLRDSGLQNIVALRGDPPRGESFAAADGGFSYASDLVALIGSEYDFCTVAACYTEPHPEAADAESDLANLCRKVEAGVDVLITNLFFSNELFFDFERRARAAGITVPIVPGIMPITQVEQVKRFAAIGGITIPAELTRELDARADDTEAVTELGVAYATLQCAELLAAGAPGIHFFTLNRSPATRAILSALRLLRPWEKAA